MSWSGFGEIGGLGLMFWLLVLALFGVVVISIIGSSSPKGVPVLSAAGRFGNLDLLEQRYMRGEIGRDEYLLKRRDIYDRR
jgi:putative membrane protein